MYIGRLARSAGVSVDAVRFYEENGLLRKAPRGPGGFRLYTRGDVERLVFVRRAQRMGFSLREIQEVLRLREDGARPCAPVRARLAEKLAAVQTKMRDLCNLEAELKQAIRKCDRALKRRNRGQTIPCPVLEDGSKNRKGMK